MKLGNFHILLLGDPENKEEMKLLKNINDRLVNRALKLGGTCSGEHGIGTEKQAYMPLVFNENDLEAMKKLRKAFVCLNPYDDPEKFNPGKIFPKEVVDDKLYGLKNPEFYPTGTKEWA